MASRYAFTEEQIRELTNAAKVNKRKDVDRRLRVLVMRAKGNKLAEIAQATGYSFSNITKLVRTYRTGGLSAIVENHYGGNHRKCDRRQKIDNVDFLPQNQIQADTKNQNRPIRDKLFPTLGRIAGHLETSTF